MKTKNDRKKKASTVSEPEQPNLLTLLRNTHKKKTISKQEGIEIINLVCRVKGSLGEGVLRDVGTALAKVEGIETMQTDPQKRHR